MMVFSQQPRPEHQQDRGGHRGLLEVQEDRTRSSPHRWGGGRVCGQHQVPGHLHHI